MMRVFERLRGRDRNGSSIERKLIETIASDLQQRIEDEIPVLVVAESNSACCSCCSADDRPHK
jgi:hypothetical protein